MKKISLFAIVITSFFSQQSKAQVKLEFKVGAAISDWRGDALGPLNSIIGLTGNNFSRKHYTGFYGGAGINLPLGKGLIVQPGLAYSQTGTTLNGGLSIKGIDMLNLNANADLVQQKLEIPLLLKAEIAKGLELIAGPQLAYQFSNKLNVQATALGINLLNKNFDVNNIFEPVTYSVLGGLQYNMASGFGIQAMYEHGLTSLVKNNTAKVYNQSARIGITYSF